MIIDTKPLTDWAVDRPVLSVGCCFIAIFLIVIKHYLIYLMGRKKEENIWQRVK